MEKLWVDNLPKGCLACKFKEVGKTDPISRYYCHILNEEIYANVDSRDHLCPLKAVEEIESVKELQDLRGKTWGYKREIAKLTFEIGMHKGKITELKARLYDAMCDLAEAKSKGKEEVHEQ